MSLQTHHGWCGVGIQSSGDGGHRPSQKSREGNRPGAGAERDGETGVGSEMLSR